MREKSRVQAEALQKVLDNSGTGLLAMCTGSGKTRIGINYIDLLKNKGRRNFCGLFLQKNFVMKGLNKNLLSGVLSFSM